MSQYELLVERGTSVEIHNQTTGWFRYSCYCFLNKWHIITDCWICTDSQKLSRQLPLHPNRMNLRFSRFNLISAVRPLEWCASFACLPARASTVHTKWQITWNQCIWLNVKRVSEANASYSDFLSWKKSRKTLQLLNVFLFPKTNAPQPSGMMKQRGNGQLNDTIIFWVAYVWLPKWTVPSGIVVLVRFNHRDPLL